MAKTVTNILKLSPTHFVSNIRHQHRFRRVVPLQNFLKTHFSRTEWDIYNEWTDYVFENSPELKLDGIIYLRADPSVCAERMRKRGRLDESGVTLEYLKGTGFIFETCSTAPPFYKPDRRNS